MSGRRTMSSCAADGEGVVVEIQLPESKVAAAETVTTPDRHNHRRYDHQQVTNNDSNTSNVSSKLDFAHVLLWMSCVFSSVTALSFMALATEDGAISVFGFQLPLRAKWSFSDPFEYLVGVSAAVIALTLLQLLISLSRLLRRSPVVPSRRQAWLNLAVDQVLAYAMISAGSAAAGVTNLNNTGVRHTIIMPKFCNSLHSFCDHVTVSIAFTFFSCFLLCASAILDVFRLSKN